MSLDTLITLRTCSERVIHKNKGKDCLFMENWKDVIGFEDYYEVSDLGRVRNKKTGRILKQRTREKKGYMSLELQKGGRETRKAFLVHRLVAAAFLGESLLQVNHKDFNKKNNELSNLEYVTAKDNVRHGVEGGVYSGRSNGRERKLLQIDPKTGEIVKVWDTVMSARYAGYTAASAVALGQRKHCKGYYWRYDE